MAAFPRILWVNFFEKKKKKIVENWVNWFD